MEIIQRLITRSDEQGHSGGPPSKSRTNKGENGGVAEGADVKNDAIKGEKKGGGKPAELEGAGRGVVLQGGARGRGVGARRGRTTGELNNGEGEVQ